MLLSAHSKQKYKPKNIYHTVVSRNIIPVKKKRPKRGRVSVSLPYVFMDFNCVVLGSVVAGAQKCVVITNHKLKTARRHRC